MQSQVDELLVCYTGPVNGLCMICELYIGVYTGPVNGFCMICELYIGVLHRSSEWFLYDL